MSLPIRLGARKHLNSKFKEDGGNGKERCACTPYFLRRHLREASVSSWRAVRLGKSDDSKRINVEVENILEKADHLNQFLFKTK